jgi:CheY-like chemotaxis protein
MPLVDGYAATRMIRESEKMHPEMLSEVALRYGRTPIFAISASLEPEMRNNLVDTGFDGCLVKPVSFKRLTILLKGAFSREFRKEGIYDNAQFVDGGWFCEDLEHMPLTISDSV